MCTAVQCNAPTCCGASCASNADCCAETVCSTSGRCIPSRCTGCGELGCVVDFDACTAECAPPASCGELCGSDADCAAGTSCRPSVDGDLRCYPDACTGCGGLTPLCSIDGACGVTCVAPQRCGESCTPGDDCGSSSVCYTFPSGVSYCVPEAFEGACRACSPLGCSFHPTSCEVTCQAVDAGTTAPDAGTTPGRDSGTTPGRDAGTTPGLDGGTGPAPGTPACTPCCSPCASDADCCPGSSCLPDTEGELRCFPSECRYCTYGCNFHCP